jgi:hypothetical protein
MKKWKAYKVIVEDSDSAYRLIIPSTSKREAEIYAEHYGMSVVKTEEMPNLKIDVDFLGRVMKEHGFGADEIDVVTRMLQIVNLDYVEPSMKVD